MENIYTNEDNIFDTPQIKSGNTLTGSVFNDLFKTEHRALKPAYTIKDFYLEDTSVNIIRLKEISNIEATLWNNQYGQFTVAFELDTTEGRVKAQWSSKNGSINIFGKNELKKVNKYEPNYSWFLKCKEELKDWKNIISIVCKKAPEDFADILRYRIPGFNDIIHNIKKFKLTGFWANKISIQYKLNNSYKHISVDRAGFALALINNEFYMGYLRIEDETYEIFFKPRNEKGKGTSRKLGYWQTN